MYSYVIVFYVFKKYLFWWWVVDGGYFVYKEYFFDIRELRYQVLIEVSFEDVVEIVCLLEIGVFLEWWVCEYMNCMWVKDCKVKMFCFNF